MRLEHLIVLGSIIVIAWYIVLSLWPSLILYVYRRAILVDGFGDGPIPINTLYTESQELFADPLAQRSTTASKLATTGVNRDTLLSVGWLDLKSGPQVLHVPDMADRYYSVQFTDPSKNTNFAYVGRRVTGTAAGDYLIAGPGWKGQAPRDMKLIPSPKNSVLVVGRVFVENEDDLPTAHALAKQLRLSPLATGK